MTSPMGEKIRTLRKKKQMTLDRLAEAAGSSKSYIWELENKSPPRPSGEKVAAIAAVLGVTADYLLDSAGELDEQNAVDKAFFREYSQMSADTKNRIREMVRLWKDHK